MRYFFIALWMLIASSNVSAKIIQCESCNTLNAAASVGAEYGTGTHYVLSLSKNRLWNFQVTLQSGAYVAEPISIAPGMQQVFNDLRYFYLKNPTNIAKSLIFQIDITKIPGVHNPIRIAEHFRINNGPGNGSNFNTWTTNFNNAMNNQALVNSMNPDLWRALHMDSQVTGFSGGIDTGRGGVEGGVQWENPVPPVVEVRACNGSGDCVRMKSLVGNDWMYLASTSRWGNGDDYPTRATCTSNGSSSGECFYTFEPGFAAEFQGGIVEAGKPVYNSITMTLRCAFVNNKLDYCMWITEPE